MIIVFSHQYIKKEVCVHMNNIQEFDNFYKLHFYVYSTRLIDITNSEGVTVGNLQRTYNNTVDHTIDAFFRLANKKI